MEQQSKGKDGAQLKRDTTPMFNYYKNWDKFTDEALKELDQESDNEEVDAGDGFIPAKKPTFVGDGPLSQAQMMQRTSGAKPNTKVVIKGGTIKKNTLADQLKAEGNAFFSSLDYDRAIEKYTRCIPEVPASDHNLRTIVYSNRAQCYLKLKKYENAYLDADKALQYDPSHLKSIQRRGTASYYTGRFRQARKDFMHSLSIEYSQVFADYLNKVIAQIEKSRVTANQKLVRQCYFNSGINFHPQNQGAPNSALSDPDLAKKAGINAFKQSSHQLQVTEMNLDEEQIRQMRAKKEELLKQMGEDDSQEKEG